MRKKNKIKIIVNGKQMTINPNYSLKNLIDKLKLPIKKIAIELNRQIVDKKKIGKINLPIVKSKLIKQLSKNYPNFLKKDLEKFINIILKEIKFTLKRGERVELRGFGVFYTKIQKARISRNPKTGEKVSTPEKKTIHFKMSKDLFKKLNNEE